MIDLKLHLRSIHNCIYIITVLVILHSGVQGLAVSGKSAKLLIDSNKVARNILQTLEQPGKTM